MAEDTSAGTEGIEKPAADSTNETGGEQANPLQAQLEAALAAVAGFKARDDAAEAKRLETATEVEKANARATKAEEAATASQGRLAAFAKAQMKGLPPHIKAALDGQSPEKILDFLAKHGDTVRATGPGTQRHEKPKTSTTSPDLDGLDSAQIGRLLAAEMRKLKTTNPRDVAKSRPELWKRYRASLN